MLRKRIFTALSLLVAAAVTLAAFGPAQAAFDGFNVLSSTFDNQFSGNQINDGVNDPGDLGDWTIAGGLPASDLTIVNTDNLLITQTSNNGWVQQDSGTSPWELGSGSWTIEVRAQLIATGVSGLDIWGALNGERNIMVVNEGSTADFGGTDYDTNSNTDGFHDFRLVYDSTADVYHYFRDAVQITPAAGIGQQAGTGNTRLIVGDCCSGFAGAGNQFEIDYVRYDMDGAFSPTSDQGVVALTIDRDTGNISLVNSTGASIDNIIGYTLLSPAGAFDQSSWDQQNGSSQLANDDDDWTVLTGAGVSTDLAEAVLTTSGAGNGGDLAASTGSWSFGNAWIKSPFEDVTLELLLDDGSLLTAAAGDFAIEYTGGQVLLGDFAGATVNDAPDGDIDLVDWAKFKAGVNTDVSAETLVGAYLLGDMTGDLAINHLDFNAFVTAYDAANGSGAFAAAVAAVPEPATAMLLVVGLVGVAGCRYRKRTVPNSAFNMSSRKNMRHLLLSLAVAAIACLAAAPASAVSDFVIASYNADVGNPANAAAIQSPLDQGFTRWEVTQQGQVHQGPPAVVQEGVIIGGVNAYRNFDGPVADPQVNTNPGFVVTLTEEAEQAMFDFGWQYTLTGVLIQGGHFTALGARDGNPWGLADDSRIGFALSVSGANWAASAVGAGGSSQDVGALGSAFGQVVITGDPQAVTATFEVFAFDSGGVGAQIGATQNLTNWAGGNGANTASIGLQSGSTGGTNREAALHNFLVTVPAPDTLTLEVNKTNGNVRLVNNSSSSVSFNGYFIDSAGGALDDTGWASLESSGQDDPTPGDNDNGDGWEEFDAVGSGFLGEGFLTSESTLAPGGSLSLGAAFDQTVFGSGNDGDLVFNLTDAAGRTIPSSLFSTVEYVTGGVVGLPGDYNGDMIVNAADYTTWRDNLGAADESSLNGNGDGMNGVDAGDYDLWKSSFGNTAGSGSGSLAAAAVPEPSSIALLGLLGIIGLGLRQRKGLQLMQISKTSLAALAAFMFLATSAIATKTDRDYRLGDDGAEGASADNALGATTFDSAGTPGAGDLQDLFVNGSPTYRSVSDRPGALGSDLGVEFDGTGDSLNTGVSMNAPSQMWDNGNFFPGPPPAIFPHNYESIFGRGMQVWAKPDQTAFGTSKLQSVLFDSLEHGIQITANDTWGLWFDAQGGPSIDSGVSVASTLDSNGWAHVMEIAGFGDQTGGGSAFNGALLVNGVAVATRGGAYDPATQDLVLGARPDGAGEFIDHYDGILDDARVFFWGDNSDELGQDGVVGGSNTDTATNNGLNADGQNWGALDLAVDNDWIAQELASMGVTDSGDVDLSGGAANAADETAFVTHWRKQQLVGGIQIGDWNSRQEGDLNYDGIVDLRDAFILHDALTAAGAGGLDFSLLTGAAVPEPTSVVIALLGLGGFAVALRRRK